MTRIVPVTGLLLFALGSAINSQNAASAETTSMHYSHTQLKHMESEAHTPEQFAKLANYFADQQKSYLEQAAAEKQEWLRRSQYTASIEAKYPRPVDTAHNLYDYYTAKAAEAGEAAAKYAHASAIPDTNKQ